MILALSGFAVRPSPPARDNALRTETFRCPPSVKAPAVLNVADDVDHVGAPLGDGDDVIRLDLDVRRRVLSLKNLLHVQFDAAELSGRIYLRTG